MIEFIKILFLAKVIVLTPEPVTIEDQLSIDAQSPIKAITTGASIRIDISEQVRFNIGNKDMFESYDFMKKNFPSGSVRVELHSKDQIVVLDRISYFSGKEKLGLNVSSKTGVPTDLEFTRIVINTSVSLKNTVVSWKNYKH